MAPFSTFICVWVFRFSFQIDFIIHAAAAVNMVYPYQVQFTCNITYIYVSWIINPLTPRSD